MKNKIFKIKQILTIIVIIICLSPFLSVLADKNNNNWINLYIKEGITVQKKAVENSSLVEFRGMGVINGSLLEIAAIIYDTKNHPKWIANCIETKILQQKSDKEYIFYSSVKAPWPLSDRDFVGKAKVFVNKKEKAIIIKSHETNHPQAPVKHGRIRMPFIRITWFMKPLAKYKGKRTRLEFKVHADPGGWIPSWVTNWVSKRISFHSIKDLRKRIKSGKADKSFMENYKEYKDWY